jgi:hypothetical protein
MRTEEIHEPSPLQIDVERKLVLEVRDLISEPQIDSAGLVRTVDAVRPGMPG